MELARQRSHLLAYSARLNFDWHEIQHPFIFHQYVSNFRAARLNSRWNPDIRGHGLTPHLAPTGFITYTTNVTYALSSCCCSTWHASPPILALDDAPSSSLSHHDTSLSPLPLSECVNSYMLPLHCTSEVTIYFLQLWLWHLWCT